MHHNRADGTRDSGSVRHTDRPARVEYAALFSKERSNLLVQTPGTPVLVGSVQELNAKIVDQQKEIDELKSEIRSLKNNH